MSHFSVMVIGEHPELQMQPYQENNMGDCPEKYMEFYSVEEESREEYENNTLTPKNFTYERLNFDKTTRERVISAKVGDLLLNIEYKPDLIYPVKLGFIYEIKKLDCFFRVAEIINDTTLALEKVNKPERQKIKDQKSFIEYVEEDCGYVYSDKNNAFGYYENPNAKWDWYETGGRWSNFLKLKPDLDVQNEIPDFNGLRGDSAKIKEIDIKGMIKEKENSASVHYDRILKVFKGNIPKVNNSWISIVQEENKKGGKFNRERAEKSYNSQSGVVDLLEFKKTVTKEKLMEHGFSENEAVFFWHNFNISDFQIPKNKYVERAGLNTFSTYAILKDGCWVEQSKMEWFGLSDNKVSEHDWAIKTQELLKSLPEDTLVTIIDCHI